MLRLVAQDLRFGARGIVLLQLCDLFKELTPPSVVKPTARQTLPGPAQSFNDVPAKSVGESPGSPDNFGYWGVLSESDPGELPTCVRREEIAITVADVGCRRYAGTAAEDELPGHELSVVFANRAARGVESGVRLERTARPLPYVAEHLLQTRCLRRRHGPQAAGVGEVAVPGCCSHCAL